MRNKTARLLAWLLLAVTVLTGCKQNPTHAELHQKLIAYFEGCGYTCRLSPLKDVQPDRDVPVYDATVWQLLTLDGEEVLLYFDESNRADYHLSRVDTDVYGHAARFGLRFLLVYPGEDADVIRALESIPND